jgi:hypothetical protein
MAKDSTRISVGGTGGVFIAPVGTAMPASPTTALNAAFIEVGYTTDAGVTFTVDRTITDIRSWQALDPTRRIVTSKDSMVGFTMQEFSKENVELALTGTVTSPSAGVFLFTPETEAALDERAVVIEFKDKVGEDDFTTRLLIPRCIVTDSVETQITKTAEMQLPIVLKPIVAGDAAPYTMLTNNVAFSVGA